VLSLEMSVIALITRKMRDFLKFSQNCSQYGVFVCICLLAPKFSSARKSTGNVMKTTYASDF